jgi:HAD superfamily hydrolase (TIGR01549 family)
MAQRKRKLKGAQSGRATAHDNARELGRSDLPAVLFDLDGTLIDSVYHHVITWSEALESAGIVFAKWKIHRRVGMSGKSFVQELLRELPKRPRVNIEHLEQQHDSKFFRVIPRLKPLPGTNELLAHLSRRKVRIAIATTGNRKHTEAILKLLKIPAGMPVVTGDDVEKAKPSPDVFVAAAERLNADISDCIVVGDSVWDLLAAGRKSALGVGLLSGGYGQEDLERAGAFRVYSDPGDLLMHIEQLGLPGE